MNYEFDILDNTDIKNIELLQNQLNLSNNNLDNSTDYINSNNINNTDGDDNIGNNDLETLQKNKKLLLDYKRIINRRKINPSDLKISTITCTRNIGNELNLYIVSRLLELYPESNKKCENSDGCFLYINNYTEKTLTDMPRGFIDKKLSFKVFSNQLTLSYKYNGFKKINVKIFSNGKLHMTGISDPDWESEHLGNIIINIIKNLKYRVYFDKSKFNNKLDFICYFEPKTKTIKYYRRNINIIDLNNIINNNKIKYDYDSNIWYNMDECERFYKKNLELAEKKLKLFNDIKYEKIYKNKIFNFEVRKRFIEFYKSHNIIEIDKKNLLNIDDDIFKDKLLSWHTDIVKFIKNYTTKLNKIKETDNKIIQNINKTYINNIKQYYNDNKNNLKDYLEFDTNMSKKEYKLSNYNIELINSDFNTRTVNDLLKLKDIFENKYDFYTYYEPNNKYSGMLIKVFCNEKYKDLDKYIPNNCFCDEQKCVMPKTPKKEKECNEITVKIFRPGSILINGAKNIDNLLYVYDMLKRIFNKHYNEIVVSNDDSNNYESNEQRKIFKKRRLIYININDLDLKLPSERNP